MKTKFSVRKISEAPFNSWVIEQKTKLFQCLVYLLEGKERALLIDSGVSTGKISDEIFALTDLPIDVACTHAHFDHIAGVAQFGIGYMDSADDDLRVKHLNKDYLIDLVKQEYSPIVYALASKYISPIVTPPPAAKWIAMPEQFDLGGRVIEVIRTPGHTAGSVCFLDRDAKMLFTGDSVCDWGILLHLEGAQGPEIFLESMKKLKALEPHYNDVWPGHHGSPALAGVIDQYIECANGIASGEIEITADKKKRIAKFKDILITLPKD